LSASSARTQCSQAPQLDLGKGTPGIGRDTRGRQGNRRKKRGREGRGRKDGERKFGERTSFHIGASFPTSSPAHKSTLWAKKTAPPFYFCNNFVKTFYSEIIIGTYILQ